MSKTTKTKNTFNTAEFGRKYYDVLDVYTNKVMSQILEKSNELNINRDALKEVNNIILEETTKVKDWDFDQLVKVAKG